MRGWARRVSLAVGTAAVCGALLMGCSDDGDDASSTSEPAESAPAVFGPAPTLDDEGSTGPDAFQLPSTNIACTVGRQAGVRCDIGTHTWTAAAAKPSDCQGDFGSTMRIEGQSVGFGCVTDSVLGQPTTLDYGEASQQGDYRCESSDQGVTCAHLPSGHGFLLSRNTYTVF